MGRAWIINCKVTVQRMAFVECKQTTDHTLTLRIGLGLAFHVQISLQARPASILRIRIWFINSEESAAIPQWEKI